MKKQKIFLTYILIALISLSACVQQNNKEEPEYADSTVITPQLKPQTPRKQETKKQNKKQVEKQVGKQVENLSSWNDTKTKKRIIDFVKAVTREGSPDFVPPESRIATFDNDGTLWVEQPTYFQVEFVLDRIKELAPQHPEWKKNKLIQTAVNHDLKKLRKKYGVNGLGKLMALTQAGMSTEEFEQIVENWIRHAKHPVTGKLYTEMVYQPMVELINYLKDNDFEIYIVSGGGTDFMRVWAGKVYGIPKAHILGSLSVLQYEKVDGKPELIKSPDILFMNDGDGKPKTIHRFIARKPIIAFGNSDGDIQMLEWCASNRYKNLPGYIHHNDAEREWNYEDLTRIETVTNGFDETKSNGWLIVDMKKDWKVIFPFDEPTGQVTMK